MAFPNPLALLPSGPAGLAAKVVLGLLLAAWYTSAPGADEQIEFKSKQDPNWKANYGRHFHLKGRGRKEFTMDKMRDEVNEMVPSKAMCGL